MNAIESEKISKKFILRGEENPYFGKEIYALKNIDLKIEKGQVVGFIGRNGAGKTTLLNIIAGVMSPTEGKIKIDGKVSCLLGLGAGFHPELSGRENIYLNASLLGMSNSEIKGKFHDIVKFSELDGFLDIPLQSYSQGMKMRLGFSIAVHVDFDILLVDETISVGDYSFQKKCYEKIESFRKLGKTMIIASQSFDIIGRICDKVAILEKGEIISFCDPLEGQEHYLKLLTEKSFSDLYPRRDFINGMQWWAIKEEWEKRVGNKLVEITGIKIFNSEKKDTLNFNLGDDIIVKVNFLVHRKVYNPHFGVAIFREDGVYCYGPNTYFDGYRFEELREGRGFFSIKYKNFNLMPGDYRFSIGIWDKIEKHPYDYLPGFHKFKINGLKNNGALINLDYIWKVKEKSLAKISVYNNSIYLSLNFDFEKNWNSIFSLGKINIKRIDILDKKGLLRDSFSHGELMRISVELEHKVISNNSYFIWFGIFREDKVYCHGASKKLLENETEISLIYPNINLLTGRYYISTIICLKDGTPIAFHHGTLPFDIYSHKKDHGTVYIDHKWRWKLYGKI